MSPNDAHVSHFDNCFGLISIIQYGCQGVAPFWKNNRYFGAWWRLYYNDGPGGTVTIGNRQTALDSKHLYLVPPFTRFLTQSTGDPLQFFCHFITGGQISIPKPQVFSFPLTPELGVLVNENYHGKPSLDHDREKTLRCLVLASTLLSRLPIQKGGERSGDPRVRQALTDMARSLDRSINVEAMADQVQMSRDGFIRLFKRETGFTPGTFYQRERLTHAARRLLSTEDPIDTIAEESGYADRFAFTRGFKAQFGTGPAAFRKERQGNKPVPSPAAKGKA